MENQGGEDSPGGCLELECVAEVKGGEPRAWGGPCLEPCSSPKQECLPSYGMAHQDMTGGSRREVTCPRSLNLFCWYMQDTTQLGS